MVARCSCFLLIGLFIFITLQNVFVPKWYYPDKYVSEPISRILPGFYSEEQDTIDVLCIGASKVLFAVSPMEMYEQHGIKSYNLATNGQSIEAGYFLLEEALKSQQPKIVVLDVSELYRTDSSKENWRYLLDAMPLSVNKMEFAQEFANLYGKENFVGALFPMLNYHERWEELEKKDFTDFTRNKKFYSKGYYVLSQQQPCYLTEKQIDEWAILLEKQEQGIYRKYTNDECYVSEEAPTLYNVEIPISNIEWLKKIKDECEAKGIELLLVNIPMIVSPAEKSNAWSKLRSNEVRKLCETMDISFWDMQYDIELGINWSTDTRDAGWHLNLLGAIKVSKALGEYLEKYDLSKSRITSWENDLKIYKEIKDIGLTQMQTDFTDYIEKLREYDEEVIIMACSNEITEGLTAIDKENLRKLGLKADFSQDMHTNSYVAVIEEGEVICEESSNRKLNCYGELKNGKDYKVVSSGWSTGAEAQININNVSYAINGNGLNIVIYDAKKDIVLDSVCFNTNKMKKSAIRKSFENSRYLVKLEAYYIENSKKNSE